jgi:hypothetical protein
VSMKRWREVFGGVRCWYLFSSPSAGKVKSCVLCWIPSEQFVILLLSSAAFCIIIYTLHKKKWITCIFLLLLAFLVPCSHPELCLSALLALSYRLIESSLPLFICSITTSPFPVFDLVFDLSFHSSSA